MAPPVETNGELPSAAIDAEAAGGVVEAVRQPISTVLIIIAMQTEALPLVHKFQLSEDTDGFYLYERCHSRRLLCLTDHLLKDNEAVTEVSVEFVRRSLDYKGAINWFPKGVPWVRYHGKYKDLNINLVWPGKDSLLGVDSIGTVSASLVAYASIQALKPELVINAGTAGGFKAKGASIGDVYLASDVAFHDRRIPIPVFDQYGIGARRSCCTPNLLKELDLKWGKLSTGDSLDMSPHDEGAILANDAVVKDMEGAAIAYVTDLLSVPAIFIKAVTDIVDGDKPTAEEFLQNLVAVTANLDQAVTKVIGFINGRCLSDL